MARYDAERVESAVSLGSDANKHTPADTDLPANVKAVVCSSDCTISFKNASGVSRTGFPAKAGVPLPFVPARITTASAGDVWLIF